VDCEQGNFYPKLENFIADVRLHKQLKSFEVTSRGLEHATMANELTTTATTTELVHANLARYAKDAQGAFAPNTVRALRADTAVFTA